MTTDLRITYTNFAQHLYAFDGLKMSPMVEGPFPGPDVPITTEPDIPWTRFDNVCQAQGRIGMCETAASTNLLEILVRFHVDPGFFAPDFQIDPLPIYRYVRARKYPNDPNGSGLRPGDTFSLLHELGLAPASARIEWIPPTARDIVDALATSPLIQGTCVDKEWNNVNPATGEIPDGDAVVNGHATCIVGGRLRYGHFWPVWDNTWKYSDGTPWGFHGRGTRSWDCHRYHLLCKPYRIRYDYAEFLNSQAFLKALEPYIVRGGDQP